ncbi:MULTISPECIES: acyl-CoA dehydrogenase family protein [Flavobacteriaceae]|uniref:Acyl-CoA dehydrogenase n=2 Tax=Flavobacteriaceae TaxID=49546 RepID=A0A4Y8AU59_9FLAO|nr:MULTISPECIES: acyl-CoA dehydrogenase family protein [Flavobacteriaceae]TEW75431.1 acyl-CoA dehydrogenase [Gramella jeungdoensis]GGK45147.1 acyl-CoA dehydrogenase [Lutibacter litoralis]
MDNFFKDTPDFKFHLKDPILKKVVKLKEDNFEQSEKFDYAPLNHEDAIDSYEKVLEIVGDICANTISPNAEGVDLEGPHIENNEVIYAKGTTEDYKALYEAGLIGMSLPRRYGGLNFPLLPYVMAAEMVARADAGFANIWGLQDCAETIYEFGSEEQKDKFLPRFNKDGATAAMVLTEPDAGSDLQAVKLKAVFNKEKNTWILNGVKRFITNGDADISLVLARSEEGTNDARGLSMFIYDRNDHAVEVRHLEKKLGIKGSPTCELVFKDAPAELVGKERFGLIKYVMSLMNSARLGVGAQSVGIADAAYREALKYAEERAQFGKVIVNFPAVYEMLTNMKIRIDALRSLLYETTRFVDIFKAYEEVMKDRTLTKEERMEMKHYGKLSNVFTPLIKLTASEACNKIAYDSLQIHGGTGFMKDFPIERIYRDARITSIYEGTSQLQAVAAIKGVTTGVFFEQIKAYDTEVLDKNCEIRTKLHKMAEEYQSISQSIIEQKNNELVDFHSTRLVEMAGNIIMGYLLVLNSQKDDKFIKTARLYVNLVRSENKERFDYMNGFSVENLEMYKNVDLEALKH